MTREEAHRILSNGLANAPSEHEWCTAFDMAIQALSQEPCDDVVSRQAVIKLFNGNIGSESALILHKVKQLPSVTQKPIERDDAISREEAVHALRKALWDYEDKTEKQFKERDDLDYEEWYFHRIFVQTMNDEDVEAICKLPSVTQKSGKWIYVREDKYRCSKCGTTTRVDEGGIDEKPMYRFCPYCGARMVEPQERSE